MQQPWTQCLHQDRQGRWLKCWSSTSSEDGNIGSCTFLDLRSLSSSPQPPSPSPHFRANYAHSCQVGRTLSRPVPSRRPSNERSHNVERVKITITLEHAHFLTDLTPSEHKSVGSHEQTKTVPVRAGIACETRRGCSRPLGSRGTLRHGWPSRAGSCAYGWVKQSLKKKGSHGSAVALRVNRGRWRMDQTCIMSTTWLGARWGRLFVYQTLRCVCSQRQACWDHGNCSAPYDDGQRSKPLVFVHYSDWEHADLDGQKN